MASVISPGRIKALALGLSVAVSGAVLGMGAALAPVQAAEAGLVIHTALDGDDVRRLASAFQATRPSALTGPVEVIEDDNATLIARWQTRYENRQATTGSGSGSAPSSSATAASSQASGPAPVEADLIWLTDRLGMTRLAEWNFLAPIPSLSVEGLPPRAVDGERRWVGTQITALGIAYNPNMARVTPAAWVDLGKSGVAGSLILPNPLQSDTALLTLTWLLHQEGGGWPLIEGWRRGGVRTVPRNSQVRQALADGSKNYAILLDYVAAAPARHPYPEPMRFLYPREGVVVTHQPIAMMKQAKAPAAARAFIAFLISRAGQEALAGLGRRPLRADVTASSALPSLDGIPQHPVDAALVAMAREKLPRFAIQFQP